MPTSAVLGENADAAMRYLALGSVLVEPLLWGGATGGAAGELVSKA